MSRVKGNTEGLRALNKRIRAVGAVAGIKIAAAAAPVLSTAVAGSYDAAQTVYGSARPLGVRGNVLSLKRTGTTRRDVRFVSDGGTKMRAVLGTPYAKYLIGKYGILPAGHQAVPDPWVAAIDREAHAVLDREVKAL